MHFPFAVALALLVCSCAGPPFPAATQVSNARSYDPWLDGEACSGDPADDAGFRFEELAPGSGKAFERGDTVRAHYVATLADGTKIHDSRLDGNLAVEMILGSSKTICGFEKGLLGMHAGGQRRVFVPARLAFGEAGRAPDVPPNADLVMVIDGFLPATPSMEKHVGPVNPARGGGGRRR